MTDELIVFAYYLYLIGDNMDCNEFRKEMSNFMENTIDEDVVEDFIKHYKSCKNCNEELEIYYMINKTFNQDSTTGNTTVSLADSYDFKKRLNHKISRYDEIIYKRYKRHFFYKLAIAGTELISLVLAVYFIFLTMGGDNVW